MDVSYLMDRNSCISHIGAHGWDNEDRILLGNFPEISNNKLETLKTYFLSSTDNLYYLLSCNNSLLEYLSLHAHPNLSQFEKFVGCTHDYLREQTELVSSLQERLYFAEVHVFEENIAHSLQGLRFSSELTATCWETIKILNYLKKPGLSISGW